MKMPHDMEQRVMKRIKSKSKSKSTRWLYAVSISAIAAGILILIGFSLFMKDGVSEKQKSVMAQHKEQQDSTVIVEKNEPIPMMAQDKPVVAQNKNMQQTVEAVEQPAKLKGNDTVSAVADDDKLNYYISLLEAEMEAVDDSVRAAQLEKIIAADFRLQQLVNRIVKGEEERAMNELQKDSTANYINF